VAASDDRIEAHYERLLFRARAEKAHAEAKLAAFEDLVRALADGSLAFIHADHAAQALLQTLEEQAPAKKNVPLSEALRDALQEESDSRNAARDNRESCSHKSEIDWECGGCGLLLGSRPSPDFGDHPCVCGKKNRPVPVNPTSFNHPSQKRNKRLGKRK
jgi:hypothetical protein